MFMVNLDRQWIRLLAISGRGETMNHQPLLAVIFFFLLLSGCHVVAVSSTAYEPEMASSGPPAIVVTERPRLVFVTQYGIYFAPDLDVDLYFDRGVWFYFYDNIWYQSSDYRGPWTVVQVKQLSPGLRKVTPGHLKKTFKEMEAKEKIKGK
jgi:hypothetical protein